MRKRYLVSPPRLSCAHTQTCVSIQLNLQSRYSTASSDASCNSSLYAATQGASSKCKCANIPLPITVIGARDYGRARRCQPAARCVVGTFVVIQATDIGRHLQNCFLPGSSLGGGVPQAVSRLDAHTHLHLRVGCYICKCLLNCNSIHPVQSKHAFACPRGAQCAPAPPALLGHPPEPAGQMGPRPMTRAFLTQVCEQHGTHEMCREHPSMNAPQIHGSFPLPSAP